MNDFTLEHYLMSLKAAAATMETHPKFSQVVSTIEYLQEELDQINARLEEERVEAARVALIEEQAALIQDGRLRRIFLSNQGLA